MNANDIELALRARAAFNDSVERVDADTRRRLRDLRLHAQLGEPGRTGSRWMWPAGVALTAALALAVFLPRLPQAPTTAVPIAPVALAQQAAQQVAQQNAAPAVTAHESSAVVAVTATPDSTEAPAVEAADPDMLSDLDFYGWLAKQPGNGTTGG